MFYHCVADFAVGLDTTAGAPVGKRTVFLCAALVLILTVAYPSLQAEDASALDLFVWLGVMLAVSVLALWPSTGRDQRAELKLERRGWADRIEFEPAQDSDRAAHTGRSSDRV